MRSAIILNLVVLGVLVSGAGAAEQLVPGQYATIQAAIDAAADGDEVVVADGVYTGDGNRDIDFFGKAITVRSENGPENCIIDCQNFGRGFYFHNSEDANSVVTGFTVTNGYAEYRGGGIYCRGSSPKIRNCKIIGNSSDGQSGGIHCGFCSSPEITNCTISGNSARSGGGIGCFHDTTPWFNWNTSPIITNCIITDNSAEQGGGIVCQQSDPKITNCTISGNKAEYGGGIACNDYSSPTIANCSIEGNGGSGIYCHHNGNPTISNCSIEENQGSGIYCYSHSSPKVTNCIIRKNNYLPGGGVRCDRHSGAIITNCIISENTGWNKGGGISSRNRSHVIISNSAITGNELDTNCYCVPFGSGVYCSDESSVEISNCVLVGNKGRSIVRCGYDSLLVMENSIIWGNLWGKIGVYDSSLRVSYSNIEGGQDYIEMGGDSILEWGEGNIDADPCFVDSGYWDANGTSDDFDDDFWVDGDYHLLAESVCINAGDPDYVAGPNETDLDGVPRVLFGRIDMGAYEYNYIETEMDFVPAMLNCGSSGNWVKAHFVLPEGYLAEDVDVDTPVVAEPVGVESVAIEVLDEGDGYYRIVAVFGREAFCEALGGDAEKELEVTVIGSFTDGVRFYGTDTIKLISDHWRHHISIINSERKGK